MKVLEGLRATHRIDYRYAELPGCVRDCLTSLGAAVTRGWVCGGIGHALILNMREGVCVSAPTAWRKQIVLDLAL